MKRKHGFLTHPLSCTSHTRKPIPRSPFPTALILPFRLSHHRIHRGFVGYLKRCESDTTEQPVDIYRKSKMALLKRFLKSVLLSCNFIHGRDILKIIRRRNRHSCAWLWYKMDAPCKWVNDRIELPNTDMGRHCM